MSAVADFVRALAARGITLSLTAFGVVPIGGQPTQAEWDFIHEHDVELAKHVGSLPAPPVAVREPIPAANRNGRKPQRRRAPERPAASQTTKREPSVDDDRRALPERVVALAREHARFWHTPQGEAFATISFEDHREHYPIASRGFRRWLNALAYDHFGRVLAAPALAEVCLTLEGFAIHRGEDHPVFLRVAEHNGKLYIDLCDTQWGAIELDTDGWRIVTHPVVRFRRSRGMLALPSPQRGANLDELRNYLNLASDNDLRLVIVWLLAAYRPRGPYPVLTLTGEQGSAKSTNARVLRRLLDPNVADLRKEPRDRRDLAITAQNTWLMALDNLSRLPSWLSDDLCVLATGGGFATRELFSDAEELVLDAQRPALLTSISEIAVRGDLVDRAVAVTMPVIADEARQTEDEFWAAFEAARPRLLGALLETIAGALRELPGVKLDRMPRMADFARWGVAVERAAGWPAGSFLAAYERNRQDANSATLDTPLGEAIRALVAERQEWEGTASELLEALSESVAPADGSGRRPKLPDDWPKSGRGLSGVLRRLAPALRRVGIDVVLDRREGHERKRVIALKASITKAPSAPSAVADGQRWSVGAIVRLPGGGEAEVEAVVERDGEVWLRTHRDYIRAADVQLLAPGGAP